jgi:hypothetical protein
MKKKLVITLFAAALILGFVSQEPTQAEQERPRITSTQPGTFVTLSN